MSTMRDHYLDTLESTHPSPRLMRVIADLRAEYRGHWGPTGIEVIDVELVACTLGQRDHAELQVRS